MKPTHTEPARSRRSKLLNLLLVVLALGTLLCVQGCSEDDDENPLLPAPWLPLT
jgi:hypothetical protein